MSEDPPQKQVVDPEHILTDDHQVFQFMSQALGRTIRERNEALAKAERAHYLATHDDLTGLLNKTGLSEAIKDFETAGKKPLVIMADVTNLKAINDKHPDRHDAGDKFLVGAANILTSAVRKGTIVARTGGDEFVMLMDANAGRESYQTGHHQADLSPDEIADRVRQRIDVSMNLYLLANADDLGGANVHIATGYGVADNYEEARHQADLAMYEHKQEQHGPAGGYR